MTLNKTLSEMVRYLVGKKSYLNSCDNYFLIDNLCENGLSDLHIKIYRPYSTTINLYYKNYKYGVIFYHGTQISYEFNMTTNHKDSRHKLVTRLCNKNLINILIYKLCQTLYKDQQYECYLIKHHQKW